MRVSGESWVYGVPGLCPQWKGIGEKTGSWPRWLGGVFPIDGLLVVIAFRWLPSGMCRWMHRFAGVVVRCFRWSGLGRFSGYAARGEAGRYGLSSDL